MDDGQKGEGAGSIDRQKGEGQECVVRGEGVGDVSWPVERTERQSFVLQLLISLVASAASCRWWLAPEIRVLGRGRRISIPTSCPALLRRL
jgi:hypothetical protein